MATIHLPFAASATRRAPTTDELANGYGCGDADLELFDFLAWWFSGQISGVMTAAGFTPDDADLARLAIAIQSSKMNWAATFGGTANALTATLSPAPPALSAGLIVRGTIATTNTGAATINVNGLGAKAVTRKDGSALIAGNLVAGSVVTLIYDGTSFRALTGLTKVKQMLVVAGTSTATVQNWTVPAGVRQVYGKVIGGGGGGGGANAGSNAYGGSGGGGGIAEGWFSTTPGASITLTAGALGIGGFSGAGSPLGAGTSGGTSSIGSIMSATGGTFGYGSNGVSPYNGGNAGVGSGGTLNDSYSMGDEGSALNGIGVPGKGGGPGGASSETNGNHGQGYGGGGGGGGPSGNGGNGKPGIVILQWEE